ncbi:hypothetical protein CHLRE_10g464450v5 [Chlamydomonas reinhardtii]|uniref:BTB domain-containing protein n=1 Tax=Chlamydomonas reinhardtii TaxID=3055 RepID=A0A2K3DC47_CHLRE|nr:uncharacterized protein CHLRE_10g464450v5 [Chlamydomonas reinhardtii]PNW78107.1 hypothetical protein CHLRE_10g464450v5 [Chlamydomonas reinhardtii]
MDRRGQIDFAAMQQQQQGAAARDQGPFRQGLATSGTASLSSPPNTHEPTAACEPPPSGQSKEHEYGSRFASGFLRYLESGDLADVVVVVESEGPEQPQHTGAGATTSGSSPSVQAWEHQAACTGEYRLHGLLLAHHSAFFAAALGQDHFADSAARRIRLSLDAAVAPHWPALVRYFYTDTVALSDTCALPLLALARQLLVPALDAACADYVRRRLCGGNCLEHLRAAVRFALHDLHAECVALAAQAFPLLYASPDLCGLPPASLLELLTAPGLQVHCELQVVEAVVRYLASTHVEPEAARALCAQIRFPYLDNATITRLAVAADPGIGAVAAAAASGAAPAPATSPPASAAAEAAAAGDAQGTGAAAASPSTSAAGAGAGAGSSSSSSSSSPVRAPATASGGVAGGADQAPEEALPSPPAGAAGTRRPGGSAGSPAALQDGSSGGAGPRDGVNGDADDPDEGLLSPSAETSAASSPAVSGGGAGPAGQAAAEGHAAAAADGFASAAAAGIAAHTAGVPVTVSVPVAALVPRDLALEGALARLAAMEFAGKIPGGFQPHPHHPLDGNASPGALALTATSASHPLPLSNASPAAAAAAAAAAASPGRRPLAFFRSVGGGAGSGPQAHALALGPNVSGGGAAGSPAAPSSHPHPHQAPPHTQHQHQHQQSGAVPFAGAAGAVAGAGGGCDPAAAYAACCLPPPRPSYCCALAHGLPGGTAWVDVALEALWEHLVPFMAVQVSGCGEGSPAHVLSADPDCFFETNDSAESLPWIEVVLPRNVHVLQLNRYSFMHGHRRAGYYRARNFKTQIAARPAVEPPPLGALQQQPQSMPLTSAQQQGQGGQVAPPSAQHGAPAAGAAGAAVRAATGPTSGSSSSSSSSDAAVARGYVDLPTRMTEQFDVSVLGGGAGGAGCGGGLGPWRCLRLQATGAQEDGVHRLCVRALRMYGTARVDLMQQAGGFTVQPAWVLNARVEPHPYPHTHTHYPGGAGGGYGGGAPGGAGGGGGAAGGGYGVPQHHHPQNGGGLLHAYHSWNG